jgi:hypothetical protein
LLTGSGHRLRAANGDDPEGRAIDASNLRTGMPAVATAAALAITTLLPSNHQPGHPATAPLAAWTVATQAGGGIRVTIHELRNPAGLQRALRADGVPASVTFLGHLNPACQPYSSTGSKSQRRHLLTSVVTSYPPPITSRSSTPRPSLPAPGC